jgi:cysteine synthase/biotin carboxylase
MATMRFDSVTDAIGHTPVVRLGLPTAPGVAVFAKLELLNMFAMKDRVARQVILEARANRVLKPGAPIIESSSGTMALGLALAGTALGHPVHIVTDPRIDAITLVKLRSLGCRVHVVEEMTGRGWQSARLERLAALRADHPDAFWPRQYANPQNPLAYAGLADELVTDLGRVDILVGAVGSGGSLCGTARALRRRQSSVAVRVVGVDATGSVLFGQPDRPGRRQSGLGNSLIPPNLDHAEIDEVHWLNDREAFVSTRALARDECLFAGNSSGSVYRVLRHLALHADPGTRIVGIFPDRGDRYVETVYNDAHLAELDRLPLREAPVKVAYGDEVRAWAYTAVPNTPRRRLVFVEANTTGTGLLAVARAHALGFAPVMLTSQPSRYPGIGEADCHVVRCDSSDDQDLRAALLAHFDLSEIAGVTTTSEFYLEATARLAATLGLTGNAPDAVARCRHKPATRAALTAAGLPQPPAVTVASVAEVAAAVVAVGLPCVVKPVADSASTGVLLCSSLREAESHAAVLLARTENVRGQRTSGEVLVEAYIAGPEYSVETFSVDGVCHVVGITRKSLGPPPDFVEMRHAFPAPLTDSAATEIGRVVTAAIEAVGLRHGACHTELRLCETGPTVIEINARLAGGMIPELVGAVTGTDLLTQHLRAAAGLPYEPAGDAGCVAGIAFITVDRMGTFGGAAGIAAAEAVPGVLQVHLAKPVGAMVKPAVDAYDRLGWIIATAGSARAVDAVLDTALDHLDVRVCSRRGMAVPA